MHGPETKIEKDVEIFDLVSDLRMHYHNLYFTFFLLPPIDIVSF
jgi:hypothetical protein